VSRFCRDTGEPFSLRQVRIAKDLAKEGLTECDKDRTTSTVKVGQKSRRVWRVQRDGLQALLGEEFPSISTEVTEVTSFER